MNELARKKCLPCDGNTPPLDEARIGALLGRVAGWVREGNAITKTYRFANYHETMAFVNATAWVSHRQDHHPELAVGYDRCKVTYSTHAVGGLSENDFICAARIDALFDA